MTTPTLQQFAEALAAVKAKRPGAPELPKWYWLGVDFEGETRLWWQDDSDPIPEEAALALCVVTAMEIGAWWENQGNPGHRVASLRQGSSLGGWIFRVYCPDGTDSHDACPSLPSAALAMLEVIGGGS